jgi:hypothetical protein
LATTAPRASTITRSISFFIRTSSGGSGVTGEL